MYKGRHGRVVAYDPVGTDGRQFFWICKKFYKEMVLRYLKELERHFGIAVIMDNAPQHRTSIVSEFLRKNKNVKAICLPTAMPELSITYWHQAKRDLPVSEYYIMIQHMHRAISEYRSLFSSVSALLMWTRLTVLTVRLSLCIIFLTLV